MRTESFEINGRKIKIYECEDPCAAAYVIGSGDDSDDIAALLKGTGAALIFIEPHDWNLELSPWEAPKVFRGGDDFGGGAAVFLNELTGTVVPAAEERLAAPSERRIIAGYSLAGLFALWSIYESDMFDAAAAVSASFWFDGFTDFVRSNDFKKAPDSIYLSIGDRERRAGNDRMKKGEACMRELFEYFSGLGINTVMELNRGNHFQDTAKRMAAGITKTLQ